MRKHEVKILKLCIVIAILVLASLILLFSYMHYKKYHFINKGRVIAEINGFKVYEKDIETRLAFLSTITEKYDLSIENIDNEMLRAILLESYANNKILKLASKKKVQKDDDLKFLAIEYYQRLIREEYINNYIINQISEDEIKNKYEEMINLVKDKEERKISHILLETEEDAKRIINIIKRRNNFELIAEQKSLDKVSAKFGGSIGYVMKEEITIPEFANISFILKQNEISKPIQTNEGWHIIRVDDIRKIKVKTYEESRDEIFETIKQKKINDFLKTLTNGSEIKFFVDINKNKKQKQQSNNNNQQQIENNNEK